MLRCNVDSKYRAVGLGLECPEEFTRLNLIYDAVINGQAEVSSELISSVIDVIFNKSVKDNVYVVLGSSIVNYVPDGLKRHIVFVNSIAELDYVTGQRSFILCNDDEFELIKELPSFCLKRTLFRTNILNYAKIVVLASCLKQVLEIALVINSLKGAFSSPSVFKPFTDDDRLLAELLYLFTDKISSILLYNRRDWSPYIFSCPLLDNSPDIPFRSAEMNPHTLNSVSCKYTVVYLCVHANTRGKDRDKTRLYLNNEYLNSLCCKSDSIFIFGQSIRCGSNELVFKPFIVWGYPGAASSRFYPVFESISRQFGIDCVRSNKEDDSQVVLQNGHKIFYPEYYMPLIDDNHFLYVHGYSTEFGSIAEVDDDTVVILLIRDFRDIVLSTVFWLYNTHRKSVEEVLYDYIVEKQGNELSSTTRLAEHTAAVLKIAKRKNTIIVRFEDIDNDPYSTYRSLFNKIGFCSHPLYNNKMDNYLRFHINAALPENSKNNYSVRKGKQGEWSNYYTEKAKELFKKESNGILQFFGYEVDDSW